MDKIRDEDLEAFKQAMAGVTPLDGHSQSSHASSKHPSPFSQRRGVAANTIPIHTLEVPNFSPKDGKEILSWRRSGLRDRDYQNLRRGRLAPYLDEIDLHGLNAREACDTITRSIARAQQEDHLFLRLIHGKGHHSESRSSRLKGLVDAVLPQHPEVLGFHSVPGNTGAVNVMLRRSRG